MNLYPSIVSPRVKTRYGGPYALAAQRCIMDLAFIFRMFNVEDRVAFVYEKGAKGTGAIADQFRRVMADDTRAEHYRISSLKFEPKSRFVPLQAADLLAYELHREQSRRSAQPETDVSLVLQSMTKIPNHFHYVSDDELRVLNAVLEVGARKAQRKRGDE